ncbi:2-isopropylmalate synthase [Halopseudomonas pachastrellae]|nr:2-isopropylmalate synthase [Halopseudomonas pachastrellae]
MSQNQVIIFDTTLRDGEQSPGASMTKDEKLRIARALEKLRVDVIEAGFAIASPGDFEAVKLIADTIQDSIICSLSRAVDADIDRAAEALAGANAGRIHTFIATSPIHMQHKLRLPPDQVVEQAVRAVKRARNLCADVEFSCEDAGRSEIDFLCRIIEAAIDAGARTINIPDTVGYAIPHQFADTIGQIIQGTECRQSDLLGALSQRLGAGGRQLACRGDAGARQVECTINGLGERAGNAALEEIVMAIKTRKDLLDVHTRIETENILAASRLVSGITGFPVQPNKAIVGANAFAHESGIHQDGVLKHRETYEIMSAQSVGWHTNKLSLGKLSGRNAFRSRLEELGIELSGEALNAAFARFKQLADRKHEIFDEDLQALVTTP